MTEHKWTKGPWVLKRGKVKKDGAQRAYFSGPYWDKFCSVWVRTDGLYDGVIDDAEGVANANLLLAAPDLYEALELVLDTCELANYQTAVIVDALAKARGENQ